MWSIFTLISINSCQNSIKIGNLPDFVPWFNILDWHRLIRPCYDDKFLVSTNTDWIDWTDFRLIVLFQPTVVLEFLLDTHSSFVPDLGCTIWSTTHNLVLTLCHTRNDVGFTGIFMLKIHLCVTCWWCDQGYVAVCWSNSDTVALGGYRNGWYNMVMGHFDVTY